MQVQRILCCDLEQMDYKSCWDLQERLFKQLIEGKISRRAQSQNTETVNHYLLLVEHPHVFTLGKSGKAEHLLAATHELKQLNAQFYPINRGGDITYHGPGQVVGYPLLDLDFFFTDIHRYLRLLEETIIQVLASYQILASRSPGETGVWIEPEHLTRARKICAFGVRCSRWVTMHGWALNVNTDLNYFNHIIPCGIKGKGVTSMKAELGCSVNVSEVKERIKTVFAQLFKAELIYTPLDGLMKVLEPAG